MHNAKYGLFMNLFCFLDIENSLAIFSFDESYD